MKLIIAIIQPEELPYIKEELLKKEIYKFTVTNAKGQGKEFPVQEVYRGISHEIDTELLVVKGDQINSNRDVFYLGEKAKIKAQGMDMNMNSDLMNLNGNVEILQDSGATIVTKNLLISHGSGKKRYSSKEKTQYKSNENIVNADKGVDINMQSEQTILLGDVKVVNGFGSSLTSYDLTIDQSNGGEIFKSDSPSRFQSNTVDIKAKKMHYDAITKKLKLTDEVKATYE